MKKSTGFVIALCIIAASCGAGVAAGMYANEKSSADKPKEKPAVISENTEVSAATVYRYCRHKYYEEEKKYVGMDMEAFKESFDGRVMEFGESKVRAVRYIDAYCPKHLIIMLDGDGLVKIKRPDGKEGYSLAAITDIAASRLRRQDLKRVETGIVVANSEIAEKTVSDLKRRYDK